MCEFSSASEFRFDAVATLHSAAVLVKRRRMTLLLLPLDLLIIAAATASGILWFRASKGRMRRVSATEHLNHQDLNRLVVAFNRTQLLNRRAALATALAAFAGAVRMALGLLTG
jgi:hypothetical protein